MKTLIINVRLVDEERDIPGALVMEDEKILEIIPMEEESGLEKHIEDAAFIIDGSSLTDGSGGLPVLMPAFVDLHAHFRDPGFPEKETLESASLAVAAGGFGTVVCMANTKPVIDTPEAAEVLYKRAETQDLIDLYPVLSLTKGMEGKELSDFTRLPPLPSAGTEL
ncbi:amidohydrolase family protein, partial [Treponema sp. OttesenSCG-928-L16]|nr:amidohydrolase family protein [Treponema sp. OttesenSCG-928-L16]